MADLSEITAVTAHLRCNVPHSITYQGRLLHAGKRAEVAHGHSYTRDFIRNEQTAGMMGWTLRDPDTKDHPEQESNSSTGEMK